MTTWFRMYNEVLDDPKVQKLPAEAFRAWVNILCLACRHDGELPPITDIAFALRMTEPKAADTLQILVDAGLLQVTADDRYMPHNWNARQYKSDVSNDRVARYRKRQRNGECNVTGNGDVTVSETAPETDTESEQKEPPVVPLAGDTTKVSRRRKPRTALPEGWEPKADHQVFAAKYGYSPTEYDWIVQDFRDGCQAKGLVYADHDQALRNWIKSDITADKIAKRRKIDGLTAPKSPEQVERERAETDAHQATIKRSEEQAAVKALARLQEAARIARERIPTTTPPDEDLIASAPDWARRIG